MLVPYSKYQLVPVPLGLTDPVSVAEVDPTAVTGPVVADGGVAAPAAGANARSAMGRATKRARFITRATDTQML